ncbi:MAG TPA: hypothetical protein VI703_05495 [Anaerolineales bacterium]|nr:hypothetical protein [Anaerolineales bacterium]
MDNAELRTALSKHFAPEGFTTVESGDLDLELTNGAERWGLTLCADREEGMAYLGAFEAAMQRMVDAHQAGDANLRLGIGIAFGSTAGGQHPSYRRALKKYSNSIVFEDLGLHLFLVHENGAVMELEPSGINLFLRDLDRWIAAQKT